MICNEQFYIVKANKKENNGGSTYSGSDHARYLSAQDAVHHDNDEPFQRIKDSKENLEERRAPVSDGEDG